MSEGRRAAGLDHWLPLLYEGLDSLFDYIGDAPLLLDLQTEAAAHERFALIKDYYDARRTAYQQDPAHSNYKPLAPDELYFAPEEFSAKLAPALRRHKILPFAAPEGGRETVIDCGGAPGRNFLPERSDETPMCSRPRLIISARSRAKARKSSSPAGATAYATGWGRCSPSMG